MIVKKAIIPAAGLGTRFLPFTKSIPKEMLPLINDAGEPVPAMHSIIKEGVESGIFDFCIITSDEKIALPAYLTSNPKLEAELDHRGKRGLLHGIDSLINQCTFSFVTQEKQLGLGHAILLAEKERLEALKRLKGFELLPSIIIDTRWCSADTGLIM